MPWHDAANDDDSIGIDVYVVYCCLTIAFLEYYEDLLLFSHYTNCMRRSSTKVTLNECCSARRATGGIAT